MKKRNALLAASLAAVTVIPLAAVAVTYNGATMTTLPLEDSPTTFVNASTDATCFEVPDAALLPTERGRTIKDLHVHDGKVFYAYGDYDYNTGSMNGGQGTNVSYFDPVTNSFHEALHGMPTEEISVIREIDGHLYIPSVDPLVPSTMNSMYATNASGTWVYEGSTLGTPGKGAPAIHVYDVAKVGDTLFMAGSRHSGAESSPGVYPGSAATIWKSTDDGDTWTEDLVVTDADIAYRDGFERFYWMATIGDVVYAIPSQVRRSTSLYRRDPDTGAWTQQPSFDFGGSTVQPQEVQSWEGHLWTVVGHGGALRWFDGTKEGQLEIPSTGQVALSATDDGRLLVTTDSGLIYQITASSDADGNKVFTLDPTYVAFSERTRDAVITMGHMWTTGPPGTAEICRTPLSAVTDTNPSKD